MIPDPYTANLENITAAKRIAEQVWAIPYGPYGMAIKILIWSSITISCYFGVLIFRWRLISFEVNM